MDELWRLGGSELIRRVAARDVSAQEVCKSFVARAEMVNAATACFIHLDGSAALASASAVDTRLRESGGGPLAGLPYAVKDIFVTPEGPPGAGAPRMQMSIRGRAAPTVERLERSGAVALGRLNLDPWGYATTGANPDHGDVRNPWDPTRVAGGSSSGAAVAVAARAVPVALAGDTGGSIRIPAALCGVTGLKPTFGRVSRRGSLPLSFSQDTVGLIAASAEDIGVVLGQIAGYDAVDPGSINAAVPDYADQLTRMVSAADRPLSATRVGVDPRLLDECAAEVGELARVALRVLEGAGATVAEVDLSCLPDLDAGATVLTQAESASLHRAGVRDRPEDYAPAVRSRIHAGLICQGSDHVDALRYQGRALREMLDGPLAQTDVLFCPVTRTGAPLASGPADDEATTIRLSVEMLRLNRPFSFIGLPALSLPVGFSPEGLPAGVQLVGRPWAEPRLLGCAAAYQARTDWHRQIPDIPAPTTTR